MWQFENKQNENAFCCTYSETHCWAINIKTTNFTIHDLQMIFQECEKWPRTQGVFPAPATEGGFAWKSTLASVDSCKSLGLWVTDNVEQQIRFIKQCMSSPYPYFTPNTWKEELAKSDKSESLLDIECQCQFHKPQEPHTIILQSRYGVEASRFIDFVFVLRQTGLWIDSTSGFEIQQSINKTPPFIIVNRGKFEIYSTPPFFNCI